jgi:uncharacterized Zn finger protein
MTHPIHHPLMLNVLQHVSTDRLQRAVNALVDGSLTITLTRQSETEIRALVRNGEGKEYGVTLTETGVFCSCKDALYRGTICKHAVALALFMIRHPQTEAKAQAEAREEAAERPVNLKLAKVRDGFAFAY